MGQKPDQLITETESDTYPSAVRTAILPDAKGQASAVEPEDEGMDADTKAAREEIERTRGQMTGTIDAISERLDPHVLAQHAKDAVHDATIGKVEGAISSATTKVQDALTSAGESLGGVAHRVQDAVAPAANTTTDAAQATGTVVMGTGRSLTGTIRAHPLPATVAGVGLGWLIWSARKEGSEPRPVNTTGARSSIAARRTNYGGQVMTVDSPDGQQGAKGLGEKLGLVPEATAQLAGKAREGAGRVGTQIQGQARQARSGFKQVLRDNPLVVGAVCVGIGALAGLAVPETEQENRLLGPTRDDLMEQATHTAQDTVARVSSVARDAISQVKEGVADSDPLANGQESAAPAGTQPRSAKEAAELAPRAVPDPIPEGETNDPTLVSRVESELFRDGTLPKGRLNIDAANGVVTLRGNLKSGAQADDLVERTRAIEGVTAVVDLLRRR